MASVSADMDITGSARHHHGMAAITRNSVDKLSRNESQRRALFNRIIGLGLFGSFLALEGCGPDPSAQTSPWSGQVLQTEHGLNFYPSGTKWIAEKLCSSSRVMPSQRMGQIAKVEFAAVRVNPTHVADDVDCTLDVVRVAAWRVIDGPAKSENLAVSAKAVRAPTQRIDPQARFEKMAPRGWRLESASDGIGSYNIDIDRPGSSTPLRVFGAITLDGRNEPNTMGGGPKAHDGSLLSQYPDVIGYNKRVSAETYGFDRMRKQEIRMVRYANPDKGIICRGYAPGQPQCHWGTPAKRMSLYFDADDLSVVLPYVLTRPGVR